jgi:hypothetical protein
LLALLIERCNDGAVIQCRLKRGDAADPVRCRSSALISGNSMALAVDWRIAFKERENATKN